MHKLSFLGKPEAESLRDHIEQLCVSWLNDWCLVRTSPHVSFALIDTLDIECSSVFFKTKSTSDGFFVINANSVDWEELIFSTISIQESYPSVYKKASETAFKDLLASIFGSYENCTDLKGPPLHIKAFCDITISFQNFGQLKITCPHWLWGSKARKTTSEQLDYKLRRESLIGKNFAAVDIIAEMGDLPLINLIDLNKGVVLKFPKVLENTFNLSLASRPIASVAIGKQDNKKAFIVLKEKKND